MAVLIDFCVTRPAVTKDDSNAFILRELRVLPADVLSVAVVPTTQHVCLAFTEGADVAYLATLHRLHDRVPWTVFGNALVFG
jgi:hypothetical protein